MMTTAKRLFVIFFLLGCFGAGAVIVAGFFGWLHPALDTVAQFRLHLSVGLAIASTLLMLRSHKQVGLVYLMIAAAGFAFSLEGTVFSRQDVARLEGKSVHRLFHMNLFWHNEEKQRVIANIIELDPLIVSLSETSTSWEGQLKRLEKKWPYDLHCAEFGFRGGVRIYSKYPFDAANNFCGSYGSFLRTDVIFPNGDRIALGSAHPRWPWPASGPKQYKSFKPVLEKLGPDALIAGDFNTTTWSHELRNFAQSGGLTIVPGVGATWFFGVAPARLTRIVGLPIDNVLAKGRVRVLSAQTLEAMGSDHLPILVEFQLN